ncbi:CvpA family protein [Myxococcota bacterium]|nr:CvpA family protein [Myxococcota bacterium]
MLADVLTCLWVTMAAVLGWKRRAVYEVMSLVALVLAYIGARLLAGPLGPMVGGIAKIGPLGGQFLATAILWFALYVGLLFLIKRMPREAEAGVRIEVDDEGNPVVRGGVMPKIGGLLLGAVRGLILFLGVVSLLVALIPVFLYKDGRGTAMIQPASITMKLLKEHEPVLRAMEDTAKGLRALQHLRANATVRARVMRQHPELKALYDSPKLQRIRQETTLLTKANQRRQGRRDSTLLLWLSPYQEAVRDPEVVQALATFARLAPAPYDQHKDKGAAKKQDGGA